MRGCFERIVKSTIVPFLAVLWCWSVAAQPTAVVGEQLRHQYVPTMLFDPASGVSLVALEGTILTIRQGGIKGNPEFVAGYTPNYYSQGDLSRSRICRKARSPNSYSYRGGSSGWHEGGRN